MPRVLISFVLLDRAFGAQTSHDKFILYHPWCLQFSPHSSYIHEAWVWLHITQNRITVISTGKTFIYLPSKWSRYEALLSFCSTIVSVAYICKSTSLSMVLVECRPPCPGRRTEVTARKGGHIEWASFEQASWRRPTIHCLDLTTLNLVTWTHLNRRLGNAIFQLGILSSQRRLGFCYKERKRRWVLDGNWKVTQQ